MLKFVSVKPRSTKSDSAAAEAMNEDGSSLSSSSKPKQQERPGFSYVMKTGDLFSSPDTHSMAHCISADIRLGKGIAVLFRNKFGGIDDLKKQGAKPGGLAVLKRGDRYIYNLVTKDKYWQKPTYQTLKSSLEAMKHHCKQHRVNNVAMPMIGCGLDGLEWKKVENVIRDIFQDTDVSITVYRLGSSSLSCECRKQKRKMDWKCICGK